MGLGLDNIILVKTDAVGRMIPEELDRVIQESKDKVTLTHSKPNSR